MNPRPAREPNRPDAVFDSETYACPAGMRVLAALGGAAAVIIAIAWGAGAAAPPWTTAIVVGSAVSVVVNATHVATAELTLTTDSLVFRSLVMRRVTTWSEVDHVELIGTTPGLGRRFLAAWAPLLVMTVVLTALTLPFVFVSTSTVSKALGAPALQVIIWGGIFAMKAVYLRLFPRSRAAVSLRNGVSVITKDGTAFAYLPGRLAPEAQLDLRRRCRALGVPPRVAF